MLGVQALAQIPLHGFSIPAVPTIGHVMCSEPVPLNKWQEQFSNTAIFGSRSSQMHMVDVSNITHANIDPVRSGPIALFLGHPPGCSTRCCSADDRV